jgi:hypothetical protein
VTNTLAYYDNRKFYYAGSWSLYHKYFHGQIMIPVVS